MRQNRDKGLGGPNLPLDKFSTLSPADTGLGSCAVGGRELMLPRTASRQQRVSRNREWVEGTDISSPHLLALINLKQIH